MFPSFAPFLYEEVVQELIDLPVTSTAVDSMITSTCIDVSQENGKTIVCTCHVPVREHPESKAPNFFLCEHIQQVRRVCEMYIVVATTVRKQVVEVMEGRDVRDRSCHVTLRVHLRQVHVALGVDCVCETSKLPKYEPTGLRIEDLP